MFDGVEVHKVNTLNVKGKTKRFGRTIGRRNDYKKAYVTLKSGQEVTNEALSQADDTAQSNIADNSDLQATDAPATANDAQVNA